jgi:hypothetical protein
MGGRGCQGVSQSAVWWVLSCITPQCRRSRCAKLRSPRPRTCEKTRAGLRKHRMKEGLGKVSSASITAKWKISNVVSLTPLCTSTTRRLLDMTP